LKSTGVFLSREDIGNLMEKFGSKGELDYEQLSLNLGLH
jgi:hypothetical protein